MKLLKTFTLLLALQCIVTPAFAQDDRDDEGDEEERDDEEDEDEGEGEGQRGGAWERDSEEDYSSPPVIREDARRNSAEMLSVVFNDAPMSEVEARLKLFMDEKKLCGGTTCADGDFEFFSALLSHLKTLLTSEPNYHEFSAPGFHDQVVGAFMGYAEQVVTNH
jgi:hypothetical protein